MNEQAVNPDPNDAPTQEAPAGEVAQEPSLDSLLAEFETPAVETPPETPAAPEAPAIDPTVADFMQRQIQKETDEALGEAAKQLRESVGETDLPESWFEAHLYRAGAKDQRITDAFNARDKKPSQWAAVVKQMGKELAKDLVKTDPASTESWKAVESSVHSSQTTTPSKSEVTEKDLRKMTNAEFEAFRREQGFK